MTLCITDHTHPPESDKLRNREKIPFDETVVASMSADNKRNTKIEKMPFDRTGVASLSPDPKLGIKIE